MNDIEEFLKEGYKDYMLENHKHVAFYIGLSQIILTALFLFGIVAIWIFTWWWKFALSLAVIFFIRRHVIKQINQRYFKEYLNQ